MADPIHDRDALALALRLIEREAESYLEGVDAALVRPRRYPLIEGESANRRRGLARSAGGARCDLE
jgi:hypothetical protein